MKSTSMIASDRNEEENGAEGADLGREGEAAMPVWDGKKSKMLEVLRDQLKKWESSFWAEHGRKPSEDDILNNRVICESLCFILKRLLSSMFLILMCVCVQLESTESTRN